jgi:uncharacterized membrane protein
MKNEKIRKITGIAIFICLVVVLQLFSNYVTFGPVSITLALIPIVVGSIIYGPLAGFILGAACGVVIFFGPGTISLFWPYGIIKTFILCILKTGLAGLCSGYIYKLFYKKNNKLSVVLSSISVPIINTSIFALGALFLYKDLLLSLAPTGQNILVFLLVGFIGFNFIIEFIVNSLLSPVVLRLVNIWYDSKNN